MTVRWNSWLRSLRADGMLVENIPHATRGLKYDEPIEIEGDWTGATLEGSVRASPDGSVLAEFTCTGPTVATIGDTTTSTWLVSLAAGSGANSTGVLPADSDVDGIEEFPCSFRLTPASGDETTVAGGLFTVRGIV